MIPMVDLKQQYHDLRPALDKALAEAMENTHFVLGPNVQQFEQEAAAYLGAAHAVSCNSGTDALHLALRAAGIGPGDEVITSPFTFIATAEAIVYTGATPVFVDIDPETFNLDPERVREAITPQTEAILPVHLFGQPADMGALTAIAEEYALKVIEDCAQSFGASVDGRQTGSLGLAGAFSFFPSKNLGCFGDGGLITCDDGDLAARLRSLRNHGSEVRYYHDEIGYNSRLDELQAVVLRAKLKRIDEYNARRRRVAHRYSAALTGSGVTPPVEDGKGVHVYHQYTVLTDRREAIAEALKAADIASAIYYPVPLHRQKAFAGLSRRGELPVCESVASRCLSLPIFPELGDDDVDRIAAVITALNA